MPLPIIANTWRVAVQGKTPVNSSWVNVLHFSWLTTGAPTSTDLTALNSKIQKLYAGPNYTGGAYVLLKSNTQVALIQSTMTPLNGTGLSSVLSLSGAGAAAGASMPTEVTQVVTLRTTLRGRSFRGRVYLPPFAVTFYGADGQMTGTDRDAVQAQVQAFNADLASINWGWVVASYKLSTATLITSFSMDRVADVQRRRKS